MQVQVEDATVEVQPAATCGEALAQALSKKRLKKVVACRGESGLMDTSRPVSEAGPAVVPVYEDTAEGLDVIRHSAAHIMAEAVKKLFPSAQVTIGPAVENGFYYDFDYERPFTPEDMEAIEAEMRRIVAEDQPFIRREMPAAEAWELFKSMGEHYKGEIIKDLGEATVSLYANGDFLDLCRGPHIPSTRFLKAFKLTSVAGAYWRGDEHNKMLQRLYGTAFASEKDLKKHLDAIEEAKKRDHRKLGTQLDLFSFHEQGGAGMAYWHPKGALVRAILEDFVTKEHLKRGYELVRGPQILKRDLWETSGHYDNYRENMYFTQIDETPYGVKPMNCVAHMLIYNARLRSYRDMPQRYFELGVVHRHEKSGVLHGLLRVRVFTQDDAHIICRPDQLAHEIKGVIKWAQDLMGLFDFDYSMELSTRPEKSIGSDEDWERATKALGDAMDDMGLPYEVNEGDGAFYGPKIDVKVRDCLGREWQCSTIQVDFTLPERFDLVYIGDDGERHRPVMVHRAIMGSVERFIGVLIEHYAGAFPTWLAPVQARVLNITDDQAEFCEQVRASLAARGIRVETDLRNEKLGYKVREAQMEKIPYILVVGDKEVEARGVNMRLRGDNKGLKGLDEAAAIILADCDEPFKRGGMSYSFCHSSPV